MVHVISRLLQRQADLFVQDRIGEMAEGFAFPCPVQVGRDLLVMWTPSDLADALRLQRQAFVALGATSLVPRLGAVELPRKGRLRAWVRWAPDFGHPAAANEVDAVYYLRSRGGDREPLIEMVACAPVAIPTPKAPPHPAAPPRIDA